MTKKRYLIRLDDACPTMHAAKWKKIESILDSYAIKPMVGVIPNNKDTKQSYSVPNLHFWNLVKSWSDKGWTIAMHGYE